MPEIKQSYYLQQAFNFTDTDLKANRSGKLTRKQAFQTCKAELPGLFSMLFILVLISTLFIYSAETLLQRFMIFIVFSPIFLALYATIGISVRLFDDLKNSNIVTSVNIVHKLNPKSYKSRIKWRGYYIKLGENKPELAVTEAGYRLLKDGSYYRIHYLLKSCIVLSIEETALSVAIHEIKDELKYLESQESSLKGKNDGRSTKNKT